LAKTFGSKDDNESIKLMKIQFPSFCAFVLLAVPPAFAAQKAEHKTWTDPESALHEDTDFAIQGEYQNSEAGKVIGAQVVALGSGRFDVYILDGGQPGEGWEPGKSRALLKGGRKDDVVVCADDSGKLTATIANGLFSLKAADGIKHELIRTERHSPTLGTKPPDGAVVLFDGTSADHWENGKMASGHLLATGCSSKRHFSNYKLHVEFRTPYKPTATGQQRGNSGIYCGGRWETQILDSFGLVGNDNECGGIYSISKPRLNMCLPPLVWQTYDIEFTAAKFQASGKREAWPRITVRLNGVLVHEDLELAKDFTASAPISKPLDGAEGPVFLQDHSNPVVFRNIWIVPGPVGETTPMHEPGDLQHIDK
jgi:hypothetical protein